VHWQTTFKDFYSKHYSTYRQLAWQHSMSTAMLRASFPKGAKELSVSLLQALVLLLFNDADELSYEAIKEQLGMKDDKELQRTLLSLSAGKVRLAAAGRGRGAQCERCPILNRAHHTLALKTHVPFDLPHDMRCHAAVPANPWPGSGFVTGRWPHAGGCNAITSPHFSCKNTHLLRMHGPAPRG
jgi:hypothetical protein